MRWELIKPNTNFVSNFDKVMNDFFNLESLDKFEHEWSPKIDVEESKNYLKIKAEIPGIDEKNLNVSLDNHILTISGEKKEESEKKDEKNRYIVSERRFGSFSRSIKVPEDIKVDAIKAEYKNGILDLFLPKDETKAPKKIDIKIQ